MPAAIIRLALLIAGLVVAGAALAQSQPQSQPAAQPQSPPAAQPQSPPAAQPQSPPAAQPAASPLAPADTSSPRATLASLIDNVDLAYHEAVALHPEAAGRALSRARNTLDLSALPPRFARDKGTEATLALKEVFDRIALPAPDAIPGEGTNVTRWRIPQTEIQIVRMDKGPHTGEFLFSAETVAHALDYYELVKALPAKEGGTPGILSAWRAVPGGGLDVAWARRIPEWARTVVAGQTLWQWIATVVVLTVSAALIGLFLFVGRRIARRRAESGVAHTFGVPMMLALGLSSAVIILAQRILDVTVNLTGDLLIAITFLLDLIGTLILGWLVVLVVFALAEFVIAARGLNPRAATGRLIRLFAGGLAVVLVVALVVVVVQGFGLPAYSIVTGLGVGGIAIGFGAQTLVRDVFSGIFFLVDDAFRPGEYIDVGTAKGVVEKVSVRSVQLRHHNGPLQTIPFGEIKRVNNFSRDWVIMKLSFRVPFDTDTEKLRKSINKLGVAMLEDPELGPQFMEPLKSQGVMEIDDFGLMMRVKFMTKPGQQFTLRRAVWRRLQELFDKEGYEFAGREVRVRGEEGHAGQALEITTDDKKADAA